MFSREIFRDPKFDPIEFVARHKHISLEQIKLELGQIQKTLKSELTELINRDYALFISLQSNMLGADKLLKLLQDPIVDFKQQVQSVEHKYAQLLQETRETLEQKNQLMQKRHMLLHLINLQQSIDRLEISLQDMDPNGLQRASNEYHKMMQLYQEEKSHPFVQKQTWKIQELGKQLSQQLTAHLEKLLDAKESIQEITRIYILLDKIPDVLVVFQQKIMGPFLESHLIARKPQLTEFDHLESVLDETLSFIKSDCVPFHESTHALLLKTDYCLLVDGVWDSISQALQNHWTSMFSPSDPDQFHKAYKTTEKFTKQFRVLLDQESQRKMDAKLQSFEEKWQLSVYYQLRENEIVSAFERDLGPETIQELGLHFKASQVLVLSITKLWDASIFLKALDLRFWKLTLLMIMRFLDWASKFETEDTILLYNDISILNRMILELYHVLMQPQLVQDPIFEQVLQQLFKSELLETLEASIINNITNQCTEPLERFVMGVPAQYRRTNKDSPQEPSAFLQMLFQPMETALGSVDLEETSVWRQKIVSNIADQFASSVQQMLESVKRTEESLKKFKKKTTVTSGASDEDKIRMQVQLDIEAVDQKLKQNGLQSTLTERLQPLLQG
ncbi:hypothetical protein EDD86DRAFT_202129 [Gorgonomyces haynaldii]|nr:hypothetical protein EDD86DRAFT_202129 [Gorgonomyces haynaldii]